MRWGSLLIAIILACGIGLAWYSDSQHKQVLQQLQTEKDALTKSNRLLEQKLGDSERIRMVLGARLDSLHCANQTLVRANGALDSTLLKVKGSYSKRSVSELEIEMINRFNATK